jgi:xanthine dehydrogenase accessory factor
MNASTRRREEPIELVAVDPFDDGACDAPAFALLEEGHRDGIDGALITITEVIGGAPRPLGTHMAVLADGRYCGYVSGGCIEPAIAREALHMIARGRSGVMRIGAGSPWIDLRLPCGGGLALRVTVAPDAHAISEIVAAIRKRRAFSVSLNPSLEIDQRPTGTGWHDGSFHRRYVPAVRLVVAGEGREAATLARIAEASGMHVSVLAMRGDLGPLVDRRTAIVLLDHDHERERPVLLQALASEAFYIGAMGSVRTHATRSDDLRRHGVEREAVARIHGPIGVIDRARDSRSLAFSILAEISSAAARDETIGQ